MVGLTVAAVLAIVNAWLTDPQKVAEACATSEFAPTRNHVAAVAV